MRLAELEPQFLRREGNVHHYVDSANEADGIFFLCPECFKHNGGSVGTHGCICWKPHIPQDVHPVPGCWSFTGDSYQNLTLVAGSSSVKLDAEGGCKAHFNVTNGEIQFHGDSGVGGSFRK